MWINFTCNFGIWHRILTSVVPLRSFGPMSSCSALGLFAGFGPMSFCSALGLFAGFGPMSSCSALGLLSAFGLMSSCSVLTTAFGSTAQCQTFTSPFLSPKTGQCTLASSIPSSLQCRIRTTVFDGTSGTLPSHCRDSLFMKRMLMYSVSIIAESCFTPLLFWKCIVAVPQKNILYSKPELWTPPCSDLCKCCLMLSICQSVSGVKKIIQHQMFVQWYNTVATLYPPALLLQLHNKCALHFKVISLLFYC